MIEVIIIHVPEWSNANLIEFIWTLSGLIGTLFTGLTLIGLLKDKFSIVQGAHVLFKKDMDAAIILYRAHIRREALRVIQMLMVLGIGLWAMTQSSIGGRSVTTVSGLIITVIFFSFMLITVAQSFEDRKTRTNIAHLLWRGGDKIA